MYTPRRAHGGAAYHYHAITLAGTLAGTLVRGD
jgi:hypothetical protein